MTKKLKTLFSVTLVIVLTIILHFIGWLSPIEIFFHRLISPASQAVYSLNINIDEKEEKFDSIEDLETAYQNLKNERLQESIDVSTLGILKQENEELRKQLNFLQEKKYDTVGGQVIGKNIDPLGNTIIINRGKDDSININYPVIAGPGVLIGKVIKVENKMSVIRLINDNQSKVAATIMNGEKSIGLVEGGYGISVRMNFIPQNEMITVGDTIVTSGLEENIPKGLVIGTIEAVEKEAYQPFQQAILHPAVNLEKLILISVIIPS